MRLNYRTRKIILSAITILVFSGYLTTQQADSLEQLLSYFSDQVVVSEVVDGDTIVVLQRGQEQRIRLIGVDTPETHHPERGEQCYGREASNYLKSLLENREVELIVDPESDNKDVYDRLLRYVFVDGQDINKILIEQGYGFAMDAFDHSRLSLYLFAQGYAKETNAGLWSSCEIDSKPYYSTNPI